MHKRVLIVGSSVRKEESRSNVLVDVIESLATTMGCRVHAWKIGYKPLPLAQHDWHKNPSLSNNDNVEGFAKELTDANIVVIVTPIYNGSYTGALKNALDCMLGDALSGKHVVLAGVGSGATATIPCLHLQDVARTMGAQVYHRFIVTMGSDINFEQKTVSDSIQTRIGEVLRGVLDEV